MVILCVAPLFLYIDSKICMFLCEGVVLTKRINSLNKLLIYGWFYSQKGKKYVF